MNDYFQRLPDADWPVDFEHENGNYINCCNSCGFYFKGHKRRTRCRMCTEFDWPDWQKLADMKCPEDTRHAHAGCWLQGEMVGYSRCMVKQVKPLTAERDYYKELSEAQILAMSKAKNHVNNAIIEGKLPNDIAIELENAYSILYAALTNQSKQP